CCKERLNVATRPRLRLGYPPRGATPAFNDMHSAYSRRGNGSRGMTLIMVSGVLAMLAALGTTFYTLTVMQTRSAVRFGDSMRAGRLAHAGIDFAVANLRQQAYRKTEDP